MASDPLLEHLKQNPIPMKPPPQLLSPCAWTVPPLEGGLACLPWLLERGGWAQYPPPGSWCVVGWSGSGMRYTWLGAIAHGTETIGQVTAYPHTSEGRILSLHSF